MSTTTSKLKVLIAPLNWGLGHATRCMPIINELGRRKIDVLLASDGGSLDLLRKEYPLLPTFELPPYDIKYSTSNMAFNMLMQAPKIKRAIAVEHKAIEQIVQEQDVSVIISDNRFGCFSKKVYSIFMSHQLNIKAPLRAAEKIIGYWNKSQINNFDFCWVPDYATSPNLSGDLSHPSPIAKVAYLGPLSRLTTSTQQTIEREVLVILSGPEPQRSHLEKIILKQAKELDDRFLIVRGKIDDPDRKQVADHIEIIGHLTAKELNKVINSSKVIIARSGYSTLMDLAKVGKPAILIPTPDQTEQEYLARRFHQLGIFYSQTQKDFQLKKALEEVKQFKGFQSEMDRETPLVNIIDEMVSKLSH